MIDNVCKVSKVSGRRVFAVSLKALLLALIFSPQAFAEKAFKIGKKVYSMDEVRQENRAKFYELEKQMFDIVDGYARTKYLENYWEKLAKKSGKSAEEEQAAYFEKNVKVSDKEVKETLEKFKNNPRLSAMSKEDQQKSVRQYLAQRAEAELVQGILSAGLKKGEFAILKKQPQEPVYSVSVTKDDQVRYGPNNTDTKPMGCEGEKCPITVVEYSEFQCPFCSKALPDIEKVLKTYKGKIRWVIRDFPLSFHDRARPAAVAAHCAGKQGKYWHMYHELFDNQRKLADTDFKGYAKNIGLDTKKFDECYSNPKEIQALIDKNFQSGVSLGVSGTPAFFINGRRLSGALPFAEFQRVIEDELKKSS